jgi:phage shock protein A
MGLFSRIANIFKSNAHKALDKIEDPILLLEQKVRDLKDSHEKSVTGLAKVTAVEIKLKKESEDLNAQVKTYHDKAVELKPRYEAAKGKEKEQLKSDITLLLNKVENLKQAAAEKKSAATAQGKIVTNLKKKVKDFTNLIKDTEANLVNLKAKKESAEVNKEISKEMSDVNFDGLASQVAELENKINSDNAEAEAWGDIDDALESDEDRLKSLLNEPSKTEDSKLFNDFLGK